MDLRKVLKMGLDKTSGISASILHFTVKCKVCSLQNRNVLLQYCWSIYCPYHWKCHSEKERDNWLFSQSPRVACLRASPNLRPSCSLQCLPLGALPGQEHGHCSRLTSAHMQHLCCFSCTSLEQALQFVAYVKQKDTKSFFFSLNVFSPHCGIGNEAVGTA